MENIITDTLIDKRFIEEQLVELLPYSIIIDSEMNIISISTGVKSLLFYEAGESIDWNINNLIKSSRKNFTSKIRQLHHQGFFEPTLFELKNKFGGGTIVKIAAFYLGLLTDSNDLIVLMVQDLDKIKKYQKILDNKIVEFNELVYRTSHDLKGPIATMRGLINIAQYESNAENLRELFSIFTDHLEILDRKTSIISSFGANESALKLNTKKISVEQLKRLAAEILENTGQKQNIVHKINTNSDNFLYYDYDVLIKIIKKVIDSIVSLNVGHALNLQFDFMDGKNELQLLYSIPEIHLESDFISIISQSENLIKEALTYEKFQRYYNLKSLITKYHGYIEFNYRPKGVFQYLIYLPKEI